MTETPAGDKRGCPSSLPPAGPHLSLWVEGRNTIVISALDGHEFRIDTDLTVRPFLLLLDGHRISAYTAHLLASALTGMAQAVHDDGLNRFGRADFRT